MKQANIFVDSFAIPPSLDICKRNRGKEEYFRYIEPKFFDSIMEPEMDPYKIKMIETWLTNDDNTMCKAISHHISFQPKFVSSLGFCKLQQNIR